MFTYVMCEYDQFIELVRNLIFFSRGSTWSKTAHIQEPPPRIESAGEGALPLDHSTHWRTEGFFLPRVYEGGWP